MRGLEWGQNLGPNLGIKYGATLSFKMASLQR